MIEYRPIPSDRADEQRALTGYAFNAQSGPYDPEEGVDERTRRRWDFGEDRGLFADDDLLVCCTHIEFAASLRGRSIPLAGLSAVASPPEHRRQGLVGRLVADSLAEYRDRGWPLAALYPFDEAFYARYGWETGCRYQRVTVEPEALSVVDGADGGSMERVRPDDYERLEPVYEAWLDDVTLATRRSEAWWRYRLFEGRDAERYCYAWVEDGEPRGYLLYRIRDGASGPRLVIREFAAADGEAYRHLLRFCYNHDSQVAEVVLYGYEQDRLIDVVRDRDAIEVTEAAGAMVRIVDVPAALEAAPYPGVDAAVASLAVADEHAPWNDATFELRVRDGTATVEETAAEPDVSLDVGTLSQLLVGYRSVERARAAGDLDLHEPAAAETLTALFPETTVFLPDQF